MTELTVDSKFILDRIDALTKAVCDIDRKLKQNEKENAGNAHGFRFCPYCGRKLKEDDA